MKNEIIEQLEKQFVSLDSLYGNLTPSAWATQKDNQYGIWQWMYHTIETMQFYISDIAAGEYQFGSRFNLDWENSDAEEIPSPEQMKDYHNEIRLQVIDILNAKSEDDYRNSETVYPWTGANFASRCLYMIRHTQQHIGDINSVLRSHGCKTLEWR